MTRPDSAPPAVEQLLRPDDVARTLGIGKRTFERWLSAGKFPRPDIKAGPRISLWRPASVQAWIEAEARRQLGKGGGY